MHPRRENSIRWVVLFFVRVSRVRIRYVCPPPSCKNVMAFVVRVSCKQRAVAIQLVLG